MQMFNIELHIGTKILSELYRQKRSVSWLAAEIGMDDSTLRKQLKKPDIHSDLLKLISKALDKNMFSLYCCDTEENKENE